MENLISNMLNVIVFLIELGVILLLIDAIMSIIGGIFGFSWKKFLIGAAAVFGILWLRKYLKERKQKAKAEAIQELTEEDFEDVEENKNDENEERA